MNEAITYDVLQAAIDSGVREFIVCAGSRNSSFVEALRQDESVLTYYWPEERSGAFFALGRSRLTERPTAIITTSGTAAGELLAACMEAHYSGVPLLLITADRPPHFRGSGAPQSAEQKGLFGPYVSFEQDVALSGECCLKEWQRRGPAHLNVCLDEPLKQLKFSGRKLNVSSKPAEERCVSDKACDFSLLDSFLNEVKQPIVIVSTIKRHVQEAVIQFLLKLNVPVMLEAISGLREEPRLQHLRICRTEKVLETAKQWDHSIDGVLRIGGVPTHRIWRDLEYCEGQMRIYAISEVPFSGLAWNRDVLCGDIQQTLTGYKLNKTFENGCANQWLLGEVAYSQWLSELFMEEPQAEPSLLNALSKIIADDAHVYLGNSLPIREWDMSAIARPRKLIMNANRGVNGIDGQLSTFLGLCQPDRENWGIFGDLTMLYDMMGFWILSQMEPMQINIVVINNGGGQIFKRMYPYPEMLNAHALSFEPLAKMWGLAYERCESLDEISQGSGCRLIEIIPDNVATDRFWKKLSLNSVETALKN